MRQLCLAMFTCVLGAASARAEGPSTQPATTPSVSLGDPTLISLDVRNEPIPAVLQQISRDSGMQVVLEQDNPTQALPSITLSAQARPFWEVIDNICLQCNAVCFVTDEGKVYVHAGSPGVRAIATVAGPLHLTVYRVEHLCDLTAADPEYCAVSIRAMCEPKLHAAFYQDAMLPGVAKDENGLSLIPAAGADPDDPRKASTPLDHSEHITLLNGSPGPGGPSQQSLEWNVRIAAPPNAGRRIALLEGALRLWVTDQAEEFEADHLEQTVAQPRIVKLASGSELVIHQEAPGDKEQLITLGVHRHDRPVNEWHMLERQLQTTRLALIDSSGGRSQIDHSGESWTGNDHWINFRIPLPAPVKVIVQIPKSTEVQIPFSLHDLPLP